MYQIVGSCSVFRTSLFRDVLKTTDYSKKIFYGLQITYQRAEPHIELNMKKIKVWHSHTLSSDEIFFGFKKDPAVLHRVKELSKLNFLRSVSAISMSWLIMASAVAIAVNSDSWLFYLVAVLLIAGRQHSLFLLVHEATHYRLFKSSFCNDLVSNIFCAFPIFIDTDTYRSNHLSHHLYLNTEKDPDWLRKKDIPEWQFPKDRNQAFQDYRKYLYGYGAFEIFLTCRFLGGLTRAHRPNRNQFEVLVQIVYYIVLVTILLATSKYLEFFLYWIVPGVTVLPILMRLRSVSEHIGLPHEHELNQTRNVLCSSVEKYFIAPFNGSYHLDHHLFPSVPFYNLPKLHQTLLQNEEYGQHAFQNTSYLGRNRSVFNDLIKKKRHLRFLK